MELLKKDTSCFIICDCSFKAEKDTDYMYSFEFKGIPWVIILPYKPVYVSTGDSNRRKVLYNTLAKKFNLNPRLYTDFAEVPIPFRDACYIACESMSKEDARALERTLILTIGQSANKTGVLKNIFKHRLPKSTEFRLTKRFIQRLVNCNYYQFENHINKKNIIPEGSDFSIKELTRFINEQIDHTKLDTELLEKLCTSYPQFKESITTGLKEK